jgi:hypothetical protein
MHSFKCAGYSLGDMSASRRASRSAPSTAPPLPPASPPAAASAVDAAPATDAAPLAGRPSRRCAAGGDDGPPADGAVRGVDTAQPIAPPQRAPILTQARRRALWRARGVRTTKAAAQNLSAILVAHYGMGVGARAACAGEARGHERSGTRGADTARAPWPAPQPSHARQSCTQEPVITVPTWRPRAPVGLVRAPEARARGALARGKWPPTATRPAGAPRGPRCGGGAEIFVPDALPCLGGRRPPIAWP